MPTTPDRLAIVTGELAPDLSEGGQRLATALAERGIRSEPVMWNDPSVAWGSYDAVLFRSCWDYPDDRARFQALLAELAAAPVQVCNPLHVVQWNLHKSYMQTLGAAGVAIPETTVVPRGTETSLESVLASNAWDEAVVKPAIGAMSTQVWRASTATLAADDARFATQVAEQDVLVQEFVPEIATGERSAVFFGGEYSHAWNSLTTDEDVTAFDGVDADYEPTAARRSAAAAVIQAACDALDMAPAALPYARVDYVPRDDRLLLMELELIEPYLGFERGDGTVERFAEVLVSYFTRPV